MTSPLKHEFDVMVEHEEFISEQPKFKEFLVTPAQQENDMTELLYFLQLSVFCVVAVMVSFILLAMSWTPLLALPIASGLSFSILYFGKQIITSKIR